jgi:hypothetical protein
LLERLHEAERNILILRTGCRMVNIEASELMNSFQPNGH